MHKPKRIVDLDNNILNYWKLQRYETPILSGLEFIVHSVPATQASVERTFSALKLILTDQRHNLTSENLENILFLKLNESFE